MLKYKNILLVDDDEISQVIATGFLQSNGGRVKIASTGADALKMLENSGFDLVLLDINLPDMDGITVARKIREQERNCGLCKVKILTVSADASLELHDPSETSLIDGHLQKPLATSLQKELLTATGEMCCDSFCWLRNNLKDDCLFRAVLTDAIDVFPQYASELCTLVKGVGENDSKAAALLAHRFGGAAASLGDFELMHVIGNVKTDIEKGCRSDLTSLDSELQRFLNEATEVVAKM